MDRLQHVAEGIPTDAGSLALAAWRDSGPPLSPGPEDLELLSRAVHEHRRPGRRRLRALVLGPQSLVDALAWPERSEVSRFEVPVSGLGHRPAGARPIVGPAIPAAWRLPRGPFDVVVCDGLLQTLAYPVGLNDLCRQLSHSIETGGLFVARAMLPVRQESVGQLFASLDTQPPDGPAALQLRLALAMQRITPSGVLLNQLWLELRRRTRDWDALARRLHCSVEAFERLDCLQDSTTRLYFPTLNEFLRIFGDHRRTPFEMSRLSTGHSPMAHYCPVIEFRRTGNA